MDIIGSIIGAIQGLAIIFVIIGMASAFLYKIAFYVQLIIGLIETILVTYVVYSVSQFLNVGIWPTIIVFIIGLGYSLYQAAKAMVMAIINGFVLAWLGIFVLMSSGNPMGVFANFVSNIVVSAVISVFLIAIAVYAGGHMTKLMRVPKPKRPSFNKPLRDETPKTSGPDWTQPHYTNSSISKENVQYDSSFSQSNRNRQAPMSSKEYLPSPVPSSRNNGNSSAFSDETLQTRIVHINDPSKNACGICKDEWFIDSEVYKCEECGANFHKDCISEYVESKHECPKCQLRAKIYLN